MSNMDYLPKIEEQKSKKQNEIICYLKNIWENIKHWDFPFQLDAGHEWQETEVHDNCSVKIIECKRCGKIHILWEEMGTPSIITGEQFIEFIDDVKNGKYKNEK